MWRRMASWRGTLMAYALMGVVTFGYAANQRDEYNRQQKCFLEGVETPVVCYHLTSPVAAGAGAAVFWPLYWSWEVFAD